MHASAECAERSVMDDGFGTAACPHLSLPGRGGCGGLVEPFLRHGRTGDGGGMMLEARSNLYASLVEPKRLPCKCETKTKKQSVGIQT